jgi:hypothetical protein
MKQELRPSLLPKLVACGSYVSDPESSAEARRGTAMDIAFREYCVGNRIPFQALILDDQKAVEWAMKRAYELADGAFLETREDHLRIATHGMVGTADGLCEDGNWSLDQKTGIIRNYLEQQAAYALGFMDAFFVGQWTVYLLFCDQREIVTLRFTREEADAIVTGALAQAGAKPNLCEYCNWCAARWVCTERQAALDVLDSPAFDFAKATTEQLRDFLIKARVVKDFVAEARDILKDRKIAGDKTKGISLHSRRGSRFAPPQLVELHLSRLGTGDVLAAYGNMPEEKFLEIWERKMPNTPFPKDKIIEMPGSSYIKVTSKKQDALADS